MSRTGPRPLVLISGVLASLGLALFALLPGWMADPCHGLIIGTIVFSMGGGILEMVLSPIINAVPSEKKEQDMALLHSFYAWGNLTVVLSGRQVEEGSVRRRTLESIGGGDREIAPQTR